MLDRLEIQLTPRCNLKCIYCGNDQNLLFNSDIPIDFVLKAIQETKPKTILFTGGEIYLAWKLLIEILEKTKNIKYNKILSSNLTLISIDELKLLIEKYGFKTFHSSFNDLDDNMTTSIRKGNNFTRKKLIENLKFLAKCNIELKVETIIMKHTYKKLININKFLASLGVYHHKIQFLLPAGNANNNLILDKNTIISTIKNLYESKNKSSTIELTCYPYLACDDDCKELFNFKEMDFIYNQCIDGRSSCYLLANGKLLPCFLYPYKYSNINVKTHNLMYEFNNNKIFKKLRKDDEKCLACEKFYNNDIVGFKNCNHGCIVLDYLLN